MMDLANDKATLRSRLLNARQRMTEAVRADATTTLRALILAMGEVSQARVIGAYVSFGAEPGTHRLLDELRETGRTVLLPVLRADADLDWSTYDGWDSLQPGRRGLLAPAGARLGVAAISAADLVIVPALAVDAHTGIRLGRGGGSYDRALARLPASRPVMTMIYDGELLDQVPRQPHDQAVSVALTPSGAHWFGDRAG
jgi:5-formyltetrahydrofolate cyclo-ligase